MSNHFCNRLFRTDPYNFANKSFKPIPRNNNLFNDHFNKIMCSWNIIDHIVDNSLDGTVQRKRERERGSRER